MRRVQPCMASALQQGGVPGGLLALQAANWDLSAIARVLTRVVNILYTLLLWTSQRMADLVRMHPI